PYEEVLAAWATPITQLCGCLGEQLREHQLVTRSQEQAREWVARIESQLQLCWDRPRNLLVFINPFSGARMARAVWEQQAMPVFVKARIRFTAIETLHANHAYETIAGMTADELAQYQGIVAVGGDGVFQECLMGALDVGRVDCHPPPPSTSISPSTTTAKEPSQPGIRTAHPLMKFKP
ncbi:DAGKc domain-containing protein, partial [Haematococcus lacustris]